MISLLTAQDRVRSSRQGFAPAPRRCVGWWRGRREARANGNYTGTTTTNASFSAHFTFDPDYDHEARDEIPDLDLASKTVVEPVAPAAIAGGVNNLLVFNNGPVSAFLTGVFNAQQTQII